MSEAVGIAVLSISVTLAGLLLVFLGFILSAYKSFPSDTFQSVLVWYRVNASSAIAVFIFCIVNAVLSLLWLLGQSIPKSIIIGLLFATIAGVLFVAISAFIILMRR